MDVRSLSTEVTLIQSEGPYAFYEVKTYCDTGDGGMLEVHSFITHEIKFSLEHK